MKLYTTLGMNPRFIWPAMGFALPALKHLAAAISVTGAVPGSVREPGMSSYGSLWTSESFARLLKTNSTLKIQTTYRKVCQDC